VARASTVDVVVKGDYNDKDIKRAMADLAKLQAANQTFAARMQVVGQKVQDVGRSISRVGGQLTRSVTLPIVGLGAVAVKSFADFDSAMQQSLAIMGDVSDETAERMSKAARSVATSLNISHKEAAESFFFLASAGLDAEQSIAALPQVAAFAKAGMFDMARATDLATDAQSALGMTVPDAVENLANLTRVTDVFVKANTLANATVEEFSEAITEKAGVALRTAGKDIEEGTAVLAVFADQGIKGGKAGTLLSRTLEGLQKSARDNAGAMEEFNVQVFDAEGAMRPMVDIVRDLEGALGDMSVEERDAALSKMGFNKLAKNGILALLGNSEALSDYETALRDAGGTVDEVANKQLESFTEKLGTLKQMFIDIAIEFGPIIIDQFLVPLGEKLRALAEFMANLSPAQREMIVRFLGIAAAVGPVLLIVGKFVTIVGGAIKIIGLLVGAFNPVTLVIAAVIAAIVLFVLAIRHLWNNSADFRDAVMRIWAMIQAAITRVIDLVKQKLEENADTIDMLREAFAKAVEFITTYVVPVIVKFYEHYLTLLIEGIVLVISFIVEFIAAFVRLIAKFIEVGTTVATFVGDAVAWFGKLRDGIATALGSVQTTVSSVWNSILSTITGVLNRVKGVVRDAINFIIRGWNRLSFSVPSVDLGPLGKVGGFTIGVKTITELAAGGIVTRPTLALVGEAGPEAVLPLTGRNAAAAGIGQSGTTINLTVNAGIGTDGAEVGRVIVDSIKAYERRNGSVYVAA
jgi:TP901 family phage tail tape measure protein